MQQVNRPTESEELGQSVVLNWQAVTAQMPFSCQVCSLEIISLFQVKKPVFLAHFCFFLQFFKFAPQTNASGCFWNFKMNALFHSSTCSSEFSDCSSDVAAARARAWTIYSWATWKLKCASVLCLWADDLHCFSLFLAPLSHICT